MEERRQIPGPNEPELLYHYTTEKGLHGILESGVIWATHFCFLNDWTELLHFLGRLRERAEQTEAPARWKPQVQATRSLLIEQGLQHVSEFVQSLDAYLFSLTAEGSGPGNQRPGDRLSQWRGYGGNERVFSLGFSPDKLKLKVEGYCCANHLRIIAGPLECIYGENAESFEFGEAIISYVIDGLWEVGRKRVDPSSEIAAKLLEIAARFKHPGFYEERERRFVVCLPFASKRNELVKLRQGICGPTPYIAIPLNLDHENTPLREIGVGPMEDREQVAACLRLSLDKLGISGIDVFCSQIPYRNW